jgi:hypothetical protein
MASEEITEEFKNAMASWVDIKTQLAAARKDMKILNNREKELKEYIKVYMKNQQIDNVNLKKGKVSLRHTTKKATFTKDAVRNGLTIYFGGDETRTEGAMTCIIDNIPETESDVISLKGLEK